MNGEKLPFWIRIGNCIRSIYDFLELIEGFIYIVFVFVLGVVLAPFNLFYTVGKYIFGRKK